MTQQCPCGNVPDEECPCDETTRTAILGWKQRVQDGTMTSQDEAAQGIMDMAARAVVLPPTVGPPRDA